MARRRDRRTFGCGGRVAARPRVRHRQRMGASAGLMTAIVAGLVAAVFGAPNVQVSGPTGAMTVVLVPIVARSAPMRVDRRVPRGRAVTVAALVPPRALPRVHPVAGHRRFHRRDRDDHLPAAGAGSLGVAKPKGENTAAIAARAVWRAGSGNTASIALVALVAVVMVIVPRVGGRFPDRCSQLRRPRWLRRSAISMSRASEPCPRAFQAPSYQA